MESKPSSEPTADKPENAPAFPQVDVPYCMGEPVQPVFQGLSMRDYFAGQALTGLMHPSHFQIKEYPIEEHLAKCI